MTEKTFAEIKVDLESKEAQLEKETFMSPNGGSLQEIQDEVKDLCIITKNLNDEVDIEIKKINERLDALEVE